MCLDKTPHRHPKDFPSSLLFNLAFVDLLLPHSNERTKLPRAFSGRKNCEGKFLVPVFECVDVSPIRVLVWMLRQLLFFSPLFRILFFTSFKAIASVVEQLKIWFRRGYSYFSTAEAIKEKKQKLKESKKEIWRKNKSWKSKENFSRKINFSSRFQKT